MKTEKVMHILEIILIIFNTIAVDSFGCSEVLQENRRLINLD